jgi:hypothetical protein
MPGARGRAPPAGAEHRTVRAALAIAACLLAVAALAQLSTGSADPGPPPELAVQPSGPAFAHGSGHDGPPPMTVSGLSGGQATSGSVALTNHGPRSRWVWLGQGRIDQRLGEAGGRLAEALHLTVLDVTDVGAPTTVYEGPATALGARPLGFLGPGATRTYGFTALLPVQPPSPTPGVDPLRGATASLDFTWRSVEGQPARTAPAPRRRIDRRSPRVRFAVPRHQRLLQAGALRVLVRCDEPCRVRATASVRAGGTRWHAAVSARARGARTRNVRVAMSPKALAVLRRAIMAGNATVIRVRVRARDRHGNVARADDAVRLRARR